MSLLKELWLLESTTKKSKKDKRDKSADKYFSFVSGNMIFKNTCSGELSGTKKVSTDTRI